MKHETKLVGAGTWFGWKCTCGRESRYVAPLLVTERNAKSHERKYNGKAKP